MARRPTVDDLPTNKAKNQIEAPLRLKATTRLSPLSLFINCLSEMINFAATGKDKNNESSFSLNASLLKWQFELFYECKVNATSSVLLAPEWVKSTWAASIVSVHQKMIYLPLKAATPKNHTIMMLKAKMKPAKNVTHLYYWFSWKGNELKQAANNLKVCWWCRRSLLAWVRVPPSSV